VAGHLWDGGAGNWGYGGLPKDPAEYAARYKESIEKLAALKDKGIAAGVYTQTSDVEAEINGLLTYDRAQAKIPAAELRELHRPLGLE
jgi:beta-galactosidase